MALRLRFERRPSIMTVLLFLDGKRCFHLGASIKDAGEKGFALSEFERLQIVAATLSDVEAEWLRATQIPI
jgi:hypothetical protein